MLYTVGHRDSYEQYFREDETPRKLGIRDDYQGGIVFETPEEAAAYLMKKGKTGYAVYGLDTTLDNRHQLEGEDFMRIKESCFLVKL